MSNNKNSTYTRQIYTTLLVLAFLTCTIVFTVFIIKLSVQNRQHEKTKSSSHHTETPTSIQPTPCTTIPSPSPHRKHSETKTKKSNNQNKRKPSAKYSLTSSHLISNKGSHKTSCFSSPTISPLSHKKSYLAPACPFKETNKELKDNSYGYKSNDKTPTYSQSPTKKFPKFVDIDFNTQRYNEHGKDFQDLSYIGNNYTPYYDSEDGSILEQINGANTNGIENDETFENSILTPNINSDSKDSKNVQNKSTPKEKIISKFSVSEINENDLNVPGNYKHNFGRSKTTTMDYKHNKSNRIDNVVKNRYKDND